MYIKTVIKWGLGSGVALGLLLCLLAADSRSLFSKKRAVDSIYVGMPRADAILSLRAQLIDCGLTEPASEGMSCHFSDFWRRYIIVVDAKTGRVARKTAALLPAPSIFRLFGIYRSR